MGHSSLVFALGSLSPEEREQSLDWVKLPIPQGAESTQLPTVSDLDGLVSELQNEGWSVGNYGENAWAISSTSDDAMWTNLVAPSAGETHFVFEKGNVALQILILERLSRATGPLLLVFAGEEPFWVQAGTKAEGFLSKGEPEA